jgi:hypothetical protein
MFVNEFGNDIKREYVNEFMIVNCVLNVEKKLTFFHQHFSI